MTKRYKSTALAALHESMQDLHDIGAVDQRTMRKFDESCLIPVAEFAPDEIIETRNRAGVSQAVFAHYLNVSVGSVSKWERGEKHPSGPALKLLDLVRRKGLEALA
ncbi:DNA-binding transcriptional regulator [Oryzomonas sagensis]|uniref:DNA-binding transcriptional regulator n=1 Tax=Oryzomonas sagensis TaxID=2603857 RepID=A0ABQ6TNU6_9BACT|nr:DNA-binding transcriptional regulator [Oryzomonas sagensis]KAB0670332.1 DNA-binding transcriptional regulator [Oryzomonas sagensis]